MLNQIPRLADYDISPSRGFLPAEIPLERLASDYYRPWETVIQRLQGLTLSKRLHEVVDDLPVLSTDFLYSEAEWRRAYCILAFISHAYIWGGDQPRERVPPSISVPFLQTCDHLELPAVATYAGVCLWNWKPIFLEEPVDTLANLETIHTFTGSLDESWFYLVSVAIEARAAPTIPIMLEAITAARQNDTHKVTACLQAFAERLDELGNLLVRMYENCDPHVFYHRIRPFLAGSSNMHEAGLPHGVMFDTGSGPQTYVQHSGGSNAQSSIIQFFDLVLGVEHRPTGHKPPSSSSSSSSASPDTEGSAPPAPSHNFLQTMRTYMPGPHRRFLAHVASVANIRAYVHAHRADPALTTAFDACLAMLRAFRDSHIQMVSRYIIVKSRESRRASPAASRKTNLATTSTASQGHSPNKNLRGTGGTALMPFLKQARDETGEGAIDDWAKRILSTGGGGGAEDEGDENEWFGVGVKEGGEVAVVGMAGAWVADASEGGICHW